MNTIYPIIIVPTPKDYLVYIPDLDIHIQGESIFDAIRMSRDAISLWGICEEDMGKTIRLPATLNPPHKENEIVTLVDIDFESYRRAHDNRIVHKDLTIPSWLNDLAEKHGLNLSSILQDALKEYLGVHKNR